MTADTPAALEVGPTELLQRLIRFDTTNPPGNERACVEWIAEVLRGVGIEPQLVAKDPERPNLVARLAGDGQAPGLLLQGSCAPWQGSSWSWSCCATIRLHRRPT